MFKNLVEKHHVLIDEQKFERNIIKVINFWLKFFTLLQNTTKTNVYLKKGRKKNVTNMTKILRLISSYGLKTEFEIICREIIKPENQKICKSDPSRFLKSFIIHSSSYLVGVLIFLKCLRHDGTLTKDKISKIIEELQKDYKWYYRQILEIEKSELSS